MEDLRIGVIGFGLRRSIALHAHRPGEGARIVAVVDPAERARREVAEQIDAECAVHASLDEFRSATPGGLRTSATPAGTRSTCGRRAAPARGRRIGSR